MTDNIRDWNPAEGDACQGDVVLFALPKGFVVDRSDPIPAKGNRLILAEGELTGHHHAIWFNPPMFRDDAMAAALEADFKPVEAKAHGTAALYRDPDAVNRLVQLGELDTADLAIGFLVVEGAPMVLRHQEHDPIRIPPGSYYVGRQRELNAGEIRRVQD